MKEKKYKIQSAEITFLRLVKVCIKMELMITDEVRTVLIIHFKRMKNRILGTVMKYNSKGRTDQ
jgi:hypothetical protein